MENGVDEPGKEDADSKTGPFQLTHPDFHCSWVRPLLIRNADATRVKQRVSIPSLNSGTGTPPVGGGVWPV